MRVLLVAAALWACVAPAAAAEQPLAQAQDPAGTSPAPAPADAAAPAAAPLPADAPRAEAPPAAAPAVDPEAPLHFGLMADVGLPDGAGLSAVYRPLSWLRVNAGLTYNLLGFGVRGGVSLIPFYFFITPSLNLEVGHYFESNATGILQQVLPQVDLSQGGDALRRVTYDYGNAQVGLEIGSARRFIFFLRGGISYLQSNVTGFEQALQNASGDATLTAQPLKVRATFPSVKLGFLLYL